MSNNAEIFGRLTADPKVRVLDSGSSVVSLRIADNRRWTNSDGSTGESVIFHQCESWDAGFVKNLPVSLRKGMAVQVTGHFEPNTYETEEPVDAERPDGDKIRVRVYGQRLRIRTAGPDLRFQSAEITKNERDDVASATEAAIAKALAAMTPEALAALTAQVEAAEVTVEAAPAAAEEAF